MDPRDLQLIGLGGVVRVCYLPSEAALRAMVRSRTDKVKRAASRASRNDIAVAVVSSETFNRFSINSLRGCECFIRTENPSNTIGRLRDKLHNVSYLHELE